MEQNFDFTQIGKQMPYTVPDNLAMFLIVKKTLPQGSNNTDDFANVELAFNNLSTEDQNYLLEVYQEEQFMDNLLNDMKQ